MSKCLLKGFDPGAEVAGGWKRAKIYTEVHRYSDGENCIARKLVLDPAT